MKPSLHAVLKGCMSVPLARRVLSSSFLSRVRKWYSTKRLKLREEDFYKILVGPLGVKKGDVVFVHSSVDGLRPDFPAYRILDLLHEAVGEDGTLLFPCNYYSGRAEDSLRRGDVFDVRKTVTNMGLIPELARRQKGAFRSLHPTNSVVAWGRQARELTETHQNSIFPCGPESPYYKIVRHNALIIGIGVTTATLSFCHAVEDVMGDEFPIQTRTKEIFDGRVIDENGHERIVRTLAAHNNIQQRNVPKYFRRQIPSAIGRDICLLERVFFAARAKELAAKMTALARRGITIYSYGAPR